MRIVVPQMDELSFIRDDMGIPHIEARYNHWRDKGSKQDETAFSDGTLRLIGFLFAMLDGNGVILLEEPEINLNSSVVEQLPEFIARMQRYKKRQVFVTTHSYDLLSSKGIGMEEVVVLKTSPEGTVVKPLSEIPSLRDVVEAGFSVADAVLPSIKPLNVDHEIPFVPITIMRNALGKNEGGSGVPIDRKKYMDGVEFWSKNVELK